jgi:DnaJ-class molecular chaperone
MKEISGSRTCAFCHGAGRCGRCQGKGVVLQRRGSWRRARRTVCRRCDGTGSCELCHGTGRLPRAGDTP